MITEDIRNSGNHPSKTTVFDREATASALGKGGVRPRSTSPWRRPGLTSKLVGASGGAAKPIASTALAPGDGSAQAAGEDRFPVGAGAALADGRLSDEILACEGLVRTRLMHDEHVAFEMADGGFERTSAVAGADERPGVHNASFLGVQESTSPGAYQEREDRRTIVVIDPLPLRRSFVMSFIARWSQFHHLDLAGVAPEAAPTEFDARQRCVMAIISIGGDSIRNEDPLHRLKLIRALIDDGRVAVLSDRSEQQDVVAAFDAGADAYIPTTLKPDIALQALTFVLSGGDYFPPSALKAAVKGEGNDGSPEREPTLGGARPSAHDDASGLTNRQAEVLEQLSKGKSNKLIARELGMTEATVKVHVRQIMRKLGASNRTQAALCAMETIHSNGDGDPSSVVSEDAEEGAALTRPLPNERCENRSHH